MKVKALFLDIGGVLLNDGWGHLARRSAAEAFNLDLKEMEHRQELCVGAYESGKITLKEYLNEVVFYKRRSFTRAQFWKFMTEQSKPFPKMIELIRELKIRHGLKIAVVSNESRDLNLYRIRKFKIDEFVDFFVSSYIVHFAKPDKEIYQVALDMALIPANQVAYIENQLMFVQVAESLGIRGIYHTDYESTRKKLAALGLGLENLNFASSRKRKRLKHENTDSNRHS